MIICVSDIMDFRQFAVFDNQSCMIYIYSLVFIKFKITLCQIKNM